MRQRRTKLNNVFIKNSDRPSRFVVDIKKKLEEDLTPEVKMKSKLFALLCYPFGSPATNGAHTNDAGSSFASADAKALADKKATAGQAYEFLMWKSIITKLRGWLPRVNVKETAARFNSFFNRFRPDDSTFGKIKNIKTKKLGLVWLKRVVGNLFLSAKKSIILKSIVFIILFPLSISKIIFKAVYKICYLAGWPIVFSVRFVYFAIKMVLNPIAGKFGKRPGIFNGLAGLFRKNSRVFVKTPRHLTKKEKADEVKEESRGFFHPAITFAVTLIILILPFKAFTYYKSLDFENKKGKIMAVSTQGVDSLLAAARSVVEFDFSGAEDDFSQAQTNFLEARYELDSINDTLFSLASVIPNKSLRLASDSKHILAAGEAASDLGGHLNAAVNVLFNNREDSDLDQLLGELNGSLEKAAVGSINLKKELDSINAKNLPTEYQEQFLLIREKSNILAGSLSEFVDLIDKIRIFLGRLEDKRYLLVFQNNAELRASGGFIGSFALVDFRNGKIKNIEAPSGGSYDTEGGLTEMVAAPEPLRLVNPLWHFWDANWWPDWPASAEKLMWFYERSDGPTVDGVISFTPTVFSEFLDLVGPMDMTEEYGVVFTAENFWQTMQEVVEIDNINPTASTTAESESPSVEDSATTTEPELIDKKNEPKKIIGDLMAKLMDELPSRLNGDNLIGLIKLVEKNLSKKHILFYFTDPSLQEKIKEYGWDGGMKQTGRDYLSVINTNIAGAKTDKAIKEKINHLAEVYPDGTIINTVEIERAHTGGKGEIFTGVRNVNWMRVYVPKGSELIEARGFNRPDDIYFEEPDPSWKQDPDVYRTESTAETDEESGTKIYDEFGYTVFANWTMVDPGQTGTVYLKYKLPFKIVAEESNNFFDEINQLLNPNQKFAVAYSLLAQKQPGSIGSEINSRLELAPNMKIIWNYPDETVGVEEAGWQIDSRLDVDRYWAAVIEI